MKSELREAFDIIFGSIVPGYYVVIAIVVVALILFHRSNAALYRARKSEVDEKMRPIEAAFEVTMTETSGLTKKKNLRAALGYYGIGNNGGAKIYWHFRGTDWLLDEIAIGTATTSYDSWVRCDPITCEFKVRRVGVDTGELMARGLYRLGFDEAILAQLPPLSAHERLELRLTLPRGFWPQRWLDEEEERLLG